MFQNTNLKLLDIEQLFNQAPNPYVVLDRDLTIVGMNQAYLTATMRTRSDLLGVNMFVAFPSEAGSQQGDMLRMSLEKVFATGQPDHLPLIPYPIVRPDGQWEEFFWSATHTPLRNHLGVTEFVLQNTVNVTELHTLRQLAPDNKLHIQTDIMRRANAIKDENFHLGQEREYLRSLFEQAPSFMAILRGPDHIFELANTSYWELIGKRELLGKPLVEALPEVQAQGFIGILDDVLASGKTFIARGAEIKLRRGENGSLETRYLDFVYQRILGKAGEAVGVFVQGHDVTEQKLAEHAVLESETRFRTLAQSIPNHAWTTTPAGELEWCNDSAYAYAGLSQDKPLRRQIARTVYPQDRRALNAQWQQVRAQGDVFQAEIRLKRHDGDYRWHLVRAMPFKNEQGTILRWIGTSTDIEEQKQTQEQLEHLALTLENRVSERTRELERTQDILRQSQKMEAIGNLAGGIAHDFNNLLQVITGSLQLLSRQVETTPKTSRYLDNAMAATTRGARLASQLLSFGRRQPLAPKVVNLGRLIRDMDHLIRRSLGEAIEIDTIIGTDLWNTLVDPTNVENALLNLAINARDAMKGQGKLTIELGNVDFEADSDAPDAFDVAAGHYVMMAVTDTGSGISPDILEKVFDPFFTTKAEGKGTGLGLSMVYGFVKQSGGHIKIQSEVGQGATVRIYLPRSSDAEDVLTAIVSAPTGGHETILVVEDDEKVRETAVALLDDLGYTVLKARDASEGLVIVESGAAIDLLFTDVVMPGSLKSPELARKAKERLPNIGVVFTSGYTENSIVHDGKLDSGIHFLSKPYTRDQLARKLRQVLDADEARLPIKKA